VHIETNQPTLIDDLRTFLECCSCELEVRGNSVNASPRARQVNAQLGQLQLDGGFLHAWAAPHPGVDVRVDGVSRRARRPPNLTAVARDA
jgi:hypothetical protein